MTQKQYDVIIIGAGLAGLCAAKLLSEAQRSCVVLEASDRIGGRIKTDQFEGFLLDHGFQVFLSAYPEARKQLNYKTLELHDFFNGSLIRTGAHDFQKVADPWRHPIEGVQSLYNKIGTLKDKLKVADLRQALLEQNSDDYLHNEELTTEEYLKRFGFSQRMIDVFFKPFLSGIFLETDLKTSSRFFEFVFKMFSLGGASLPVNGMQAIPAQLAATLPEDTIQLNAQVSEINSGRVKLADNRIFQAPVILIATDIRNIPGFLPQHPNSRDFNAVSCFYFSAPQPPVEEPILVLNGCSSGKINNLCVPSQVAPSYAPPDQSLVSVSLLGACSDDESTVHAVKAELKDWFNPAEVETWRFLKMYSIAKALPQLKVPHNSLQQASPRFADGIYICGDALDTPSINGALASGRRAAECILSEVKV